MAFYRLPIFLDLEGKPVLLVGGGDVACAKLEKLLAAGAHVHVIAQHYASATHALLRHHGVSWEKRAFRESDVKDQVLVVSAVNTLDTHQRIAASARKQGILVNAVDEPFASDFFFAAQVQRGPLHIAISTQGSFPGFAKAVRVWLEDLLPENIEGDLNQLASLRDTVKTRIANPFQRMQGLRHQIEHWLTQNDSSQLPKLQGENS